MHPPAPGTDSERSPLQERVARILESTDFPALSRQIIDTISSIDDSASSLQRLANVVLREYSLTLSVVRVANSAHYRRGAKPIQSATHAMMMLGASTVRHLASSLLLFENYRHRSPALRELMIRSLLTANHSREIAARVGGADPEEAHLCGMFRNLGEVLVACHFPEDHTRIRTEVEENGKSEPGATVSVLGFRYEDLGIEISRHWGMPDTVMQSIRSGTSATLSTTGAITAFSHELTSTIYGGALDAADVPDAVDEILGRHAPRLRLSRTQVRDVVVAGLDETREVFSSVQGAVDAARLRRLTEAARSAFGIVAVDDAVADAGIESVAEVGIPHLRKRLREELEAKADPASESDVGSVLLVALEAALRGGPFDRVVACVLTPDRSRIIARSALGGGAEELMTQFDFAMSPRGGPVAAILLQRQWQYLPVSRAMNAQETRWSASIGVRQFGVVPLIVANRIVGCLYCDRLGSDLPNRAAMQHVKQVGDLVVKAIEVRRRAPAAETVPSSSASAAGHPQANASPGAPAIATAIASSPAAAVASAVASAVTTMGTGCTALPPEAKGALVLRLLQGESAAALCVESGVAPALLEQWRRDFLEGAFARLATG